MSETHIFGFTGVIFYLLASIRVAKQFAYHEAFVDQASKGLTLGLGIAGVILHAIALHKGMAIDQGFNLSFTNMASLVGWLIAALLIVGSLKHPLESLALIFFPIAAVSLLLSELFPEHGRIASELSAGIQLHILLSILAYSLLSIAALQALVLAYAKRNL